VIKRFALKTLLLLPVPLMVLAFNWFVDPVHLRDSAKYEAGIARLILQGSNVTNIYNPNEGAYQEFFIGGLHSRKDVLVLGSSRSKLIRSDLFPGMSFYNNSVSGAGLFDYLALYQMYRQKNLLPSIVVLEMSPWILMHNHASNWTELNAHRRELQDQALSPTPWPVRQIQSNDAAKLKFSDFLSLGYFQTSFYTWLGHRVDTTKAGTTYRPWDGSTPPQGETLLADGSAIYPERVQDADAREQVLARAIEYGARPISIPDAMDATNEQILNHFLDQLSADGVRVILYLPPYHPRSFAIMTVSPHDRIILDEEVYFRNLARQRGLTLVGSYDPGILSLDETCFYDEMHPTEDAVRQIFQGHVAGLPVPVVAAATRPDRIEMRAVQNKNGLETVDSQPFFWIGNGESILDIRSSRDGIAQLKFRAEPGPSLPQTSERSVLLSIAGGYSTLIKVEQEMDVKVLFPVQKGINYVHLNPLDKPAQLEGPPDNQRPLLLGVLGIEVSLMPPGAPLPDMGEIPFTFANGWYQVEHTGPDWLCWNDGRSVIVVHTDQDGFVLLTGQVISIQRPNVVDVLVNGVPLTTINLDWTQWEFRSFPPIRIPLRAGDNRVEFISHERAVTIPPDKRLRAIALQNLRLKLVRP
jgi:hypothetical protein